MTTNGDKLTVVVHLYVYAYITSTRVGGFNRRGILGAEVLGAGVLEAMFCYSDEGSERCWVRPAGGKKGMSWQLTGQAVVLTLCYYAFCSLRYLLARAGTLQRDSKTTNSSAEVLFLLLT